MSAMKDELMKMLIESYDKGVADATSAIVESMQFVHKREWVGLTEEEAWGMLGQMSLGASVEDVRFIEAKLKEKNT